MDSGNPGESRRGGIIGDSKGDVMVGFAHSYGHVIDIIAECRAFLDKLWLCEQLGLWDLLVEWDSAIIVGWLASGVCRYWVLYDFWEEVKDIVSELNVRFYHIFRECHMVADFLAK
ncbi:uncharacterized protein LOC122278515 [Carya illinoinensis]|uniref:uncharacterized protein LOC122278515 n=1 Tax=Carya illinoinensis TaxID=32201 RepID=UPI001C726F5B|nr:uncharacterized protein LOC122278515 [Carya illinoinensis]